MSRRSYEQHGRRHSPGGSDPILPAFTPRAFYIGNNALPDGVTDYMPWHLLLDGTELLDRSSENFPSILEDGIYAIAVTLSTNTNPMTVGGGFRASLLAGSFAGSLADGVSRPTRQFPGVAMSVVYFLSAGDQLQVQVTNEDGGAVTIDLSMGASVQRLS